MVSSNVNDVGSLDGVVCCFCCADFFHHVL